MTNLQLPKFSATQWILLGCGALAAIVVLCFCGITAIGIIAPTSESPASLPTDVSTEAPSPAPTDTPAPAPTPTDTPLPAPTDTPMIATPTDTPIPAPPPAIATDTPIPTDTPLPPPVQPTTSWNCSGDRYDCGDFNSCTTVTDYFNTCPGDPSKLDSDNDGIPCEGLCQ